MSLFTTEWLRVADDDTRRSVHDYGLRYGREARTRHDFAQIGSSRAVVPAPPSIEACCPA